MAEGIGGVGVLEATAGCLGLACAYVGSIHVLSSSSAPRWVRVHGIIK